MSKVRVCFLGTPGFAATCLEAVLEDPHYQVVGVVTQPGRPAGRQLQLTPSPVKSLAQSAGVPVISPESVNKSPAIEEIQSWGAEIAIVVAFGQILATSFFDLFSFGAVNVHASVLPRWRGAAPMQRGIEAGDTEGGVTLQKMVRALDAGDILGIRRLTIPPDMDARALHDQLAPLGAELLHVELMDYLRGNLAGTPQDPSQVTYAKKIEKSEAQLHWNDPALLLHNRVRAFVMGPGTWVPWGAKKLKIHRTGLSGVGSSGVGSSGAGLTGAQAPGTVLRADKDGIWVATGDGVLQILELQPESRSRVSAADFLKAQPLKPGVLFGSS
ncbi:MAG: methionyl-tRNA formyltransferase [Bdellovibrio sp.]|nr:MAG: methionyl-tRNA formyltransferase [Bdellovibrio sp.]